MFRVTIISIKGSGILDKLIRFVTRGLYSHTVIRIAHNMYYEAFIGRAAMPFYGMRTGLVTAERHIFMSTEEYARCKAYLERTKGAEYNLLGAICAGLRLSWFHNRDKKYCSEMVAEALNAAWGKPRLPTNVTPQRLYELLR